MNTARIVIGGVVGGIVYNIVSILVNVVALGERYKLLQSTGIYRQEPRLPFLPIWIVLTILVSIGLAWLYAVARPRLGPGPMTALLVGLVVGLICSIPGAVAEYSWAYSGGLVAMWRVIQVIGGSILATLAAGWLYTE